MCNKRIKDTIIKENKPVLEKDQQEQEDARRERGEGDDTNRKHNSSRDRGERCASNRAQTKERDQMRARARTQTRTRTKVRCDDEHECEQLVVNLPSRIRSSVVVRIQISGEAAPTSVEPP
ncbi:hypothetical protein AHAS_Ahas19G0178400 [Arachis hypogaea]